MLGSPVVDRMRIGGGQWRLGGGVLLLPTVFGLCRGVKRALVMMERACGTHQDRPGRLFLLGQIIHNPWVNEYVTRRGVRILLRGELEHLEDFVGASDCAVIPAFGVPLPFQQRLGAIGCEVVDTSCGDVRRLWAWAERAAGDGYGVMIFGRPGHDETVVTKSRLIAAGGRYVVADALSRVEQFCRIIEGELPPESFTESFSPEATNADSAASFHRLAQVSQTTMLYDETMKVRRRIRSAFVKRYGSDEGKRRVQFQPTVCRATQDRQGAAVELCRSGIDLAVVVGGFGSSNTRHLYEVSRRYADAVFIEDAAAIRSETELHTIDVDTDRPIVTHNWLPKSRPVRIAVLAGASSPDIVVGEVLVRLSEFLS